jgi:two-component system osmolarity sensor histidine kinase EnvZ
MTAAAPRSLLARTGLTLAVALALFLAFSAAVVAYFIVIPVAKRGADDLAGLMVLSAKTWVELPPRTRGDFEWELLDHHDLMLGEADLDLPVLGHPPPFVRYLKQALTRRLGRPVQMRVSEEASRWYWVDMPVGGRTLRVGFPRDRIAGRPPPAIFLVAFGGMIIILVTSLLLVRRLIRPLARLAGAASRIGRGEAFEPLPESGPTELAALARRFNRMAERITELLNNRTTLLAGISHDLRTPITRMRLALEMLPDQAQPKLVEGLRRDLGEMDRLITQALEFARGLEVREPEELDLRELIDGLVADYRRADAAVDWQPGEPCLCEVAPLALRRALANLLDNALRYGGGAVQVRCDCIPAEAVIEVLDRGPGIPERERESVFRPFYRLDASRSRATGGSGLGLAITRQLCDAHGWSVDLKSRPGGGTRARLRLPRQT